MSHQSHKLCIVLIVLIELSSSSFPIVVSTYFSLRCDFFDKKIKINTCFSCICILHCITTININLSPDCYPVNLCRNHLTCSWNLCLTEGKYFLSYLFYLILKSIQQFGFYPSVWKLKRAPSKLR